MFSQHFNIASITDEYISSIELSLGSFLFGVLQAVRA